MDMDDRDAAALRAQIAALTQANASLAASVAALADRGGPKPAAPACDMTFARLFELYVSRHRHERWAAQIHYKIKVFMAHFGERQVMSTTRADWYYWRDEIRAKTVTRMKKLPSVGTLNQDLFRVRPMLKWGVAEGLLPANPWEGVTKLKGERARATEINVSALLERLAKAPLLPAVFLVIGVEAGMRRNEIRLMRWSETDLERGRHSIPADRTKTRKARIVPLSELCIDYLKRWKDSQPTSLRGDQIFLNPNTGELYSQYWVWLQCREVLDDLDAAPQDGRVRFHDSRHTAVSRLARGGLGIFAAMKVVGHADVSQHWRYHHIDDTDRARAKEIMDSEKRKDATPVHPFSSESAKLLPRNQR